MRRWPLRRAKARGRLPPLLRPAWREEAQELLNRFGLMPAAPTPRRCAERGRAQADRYRHGCRAEAQRLLLMDEPTSGVAAAEKMAVVETLAACCATPASPPCSSSTTWMWWSASPIGWPSGRRARSPH
jgi:ABC-type sugar transport system ATPase subunit